MRIKPLILALLVTGCTTTVPVKQKFPDPPGKRTPCPSLKKLAEDAALSEVSKTVATNYTLYYQCATQNDAWIEWYSTQKKTFESGSGAEGLLKADKD